MDLRGKAHVVRLGTAFGYFWLGGALTGALVVPLIRLGGRSEAERRRRCSRVLARSMRHFHRVLRRLRLGEVDVEGYAGRLPEGPCVVVANHPTLIDVTAFLACHDDLCVVVKGPHFRLPMISTLLRGCGHIDAGSGSELDGGAVMKAALERLDEGFKVLIFPEGTRSPVGGMHQLSRGAFELAVRAEVPLATALLRCHPPALMKGVPWWRSTPREGFRLSLELLEVSDWRPWAGRARLFRKDVQRRLRESLPT